MGTWEEFWQAAVNAGVGVEEFWDLDEYEVLMVIKGYQNRVDDRRETLSPFVAALMNNSRGRRDRKVKATDLFDREKKNKRQQEYSDLETVRRQQHEARRRVRSVPLPKKARQLNEQGNPKDSPHRT